MLKWKCLNVFCCCNKSTTLQVRRLVKHCSHSCHCLISALREPVLLLIGLYSRRPVLFHLLNCIVNILNSGALLIVFVDRSIEYCPLHNFFYFQSQLPPPLIKVQTISNSKLQVFAYTFLKKDTYSRKSQRSRLPNTAPNIVILIHMYFAGKLAVHTPRMMHKQINNEDLCRKQSPHATAPSMFTL